ncbi:MAG: septum formation initiator family protein [Clostridiales bacterium]|jgi:cell division protein FtsL|nr:septum formation initiator family protein [Clostridiales bacterium]
MARKGYMLKMRTKLFLTLILLSYFLFVFIQQSFEMQTQQNSINQLQDEISEVQHENELLTRQIEQTKSREYIEKIARERLGWVKEGETIFIEKND